ncbi:MAG: UDP-N-acetylglucosamine--N-acetylmuramyl-(pentapeptide) pyrophosphoryl-undecaprenol N-acetylglucosamine transferase, partial [Omnitrophica bacterium]|nr:UDP-N-acetylglucosamine--N-acetylmuramyl-(pentapeptide) pyrophosphoryl-undecaprenol N-acetylglucosamine transferase [Candidatus Omnitrophota bacterium]
QITLVVSTHPRDRSYLEAAGYILNNVNIETISAVGLPYKFSVKFILFAAKLFWAFWKSFLIILKHSPEVVVGFGGYVSFAPLVIARIVGKPVVIHEQNLIPGRANQLLSRIADKITISFEGTTGLFSQRVAQDKIVKTGLPLRRHILHCRKELTSKVAEFRRKITILICGGSQGAHNINELVLNCLGLLDKSTLAQIRLIHLAGKKDFHYVQERYRTLRLEAQVFDFLEEMADVYESADLMIGRAGAGTIFEAASFGLPCILIPHTHGTKHQKDNALFLQRKGAALVLDEHNTSSEDLKRMLLDLINSERIRQKLSQEIRMLEVPGASHNLKEEIFTLIQR